jgi:hypothetical protein
MNRKAQIHNYIKAQKYCINFMLKIVAIGTTMKYIKKGKEN